MIPVGFGLMTVAALAISLVIGYEVEGTAGTAAAVVAGLGALGLFHVGEWALRRGRRHLVEGQRVDDLTEDVEQEARVHLLENRAAELVRKIEGLERMRDERLAELGIAASATPSMGRRWTNPNLVVVPNPE